jgi:hypothetical protein
VTGPGRLRIEPAVHTLGPGPFNDNQENFGGASAYTVKEEGARIVFRYDAGTAANPGKFEVTFFAGDPPIPGGTPVLDPADLSRNFAEIRFDGRGFPRSTVVGNNVPTATTANTTIRIAETAMNQPRTVEYMISTTGKVNTTAN